jgi:ABC-type bacteriocin/lantibiotic exporter with double-glycine peptidase domain
MNVTKQINLNECGICALNSVYEHYYGRNIKDKLLEESNIKTQGLSLYDFEKLAIKHGIFCETYKMDNKEFKDLQTKDYFVCLMKQDNGYHYVVAKKTNRDVQICDSATGKYTTRYEEFFEKFSGILILVSKTSIKQNEIKKQNIYD